jgi:hypothetical protein
MVAIIAQALTNNLSIANNSHRFLLNLTVNVKLSEFIDVIQCITCNYSAAGGLLPLLLERVG